MKKYLIALSAFAIITASASAQTERKIPGDKQQYHEKMQGEHRRHGKSMMMKQLNLSESQKEQLKNIRAGYQGKINQLEQDKTISPPDYKTKKAELQKEQKAKFESVLTTEQKNKLVQAKQESIAKREMSEEKRMDKMKSRLNLTDAQVSKLQSQHEIFKAQAKAIKENTSLSKDQKKQQLMDLKKSAQASEKNILTAEQLQKKEEMRKNRLNEMKNKRDEKS